MDFIQENTEFMPIAIVLRTRQEAIDCWDIILSSRSLSPSAMILAGKISDKFSNEAKL